MPKAKHSQRAFDLYSQMCTASFSAVADTPGLVVEQLLPYIQSIVATKASHRCKADYDDAVADSCVALLHAIRRSTLPLENHKTFLAGIRVVIMRLMAHDERDEKMRLRAEDQYASAAAQPVDPAEVVPLRDMGRRYQEELIKAMITRSRFTAVTPALCKSTTKWMLLDDRRKRPLERGLQGCKFWDRYFLARYLQALYLWSLHDLREEVLVS